MLLSGSDDAFHPLREERSCAWADVMEELKAPMELEWAARSLEVAELDGRT
jgi:hypothetical protein